MYVQHQFPLDDVVRGPDAFGVLNNLPAVHGVHKIRHIPYRGFYHAALLYAPSGADCGRFPNCGDQFIGNLPFEI